MYSNNEGAKRRAVDENANHVQTVITVSCSVIVEPWATANKCFANKLTNFSQLTGNRINLLRRGWELSCNYKPGSGN